MPTVCDGCGIFEHRGPRETSAPKATRRFGDFVSGLMLGLLTLPIMAVLALAIRIDSRGPALFRQTRVGKNRRKQDRIPDAKIQAVGERRKEDWGGRPFTFYKFRTMYVDAKDRFPELYRYEYTPDQLARLRFKIPQDPRLTRLGTVLRRTTLDELPNFVNLLRGDVTLVGPRPEIPEMVKHYRDEQRRKFEIKPGITGMAQANGRALLSFQETLDKDLEYVEKRSLRLDARIILKTIKATVLKIGAF